MILSILQILLLKKAKVVADLHQETSTPLIVVDNLLSLTDMYKEN
jgi:hypothetical protein